MSKESKFWYRFIALFLALTVVVLVLAACDGGEESPPPAPPPEESATPPPLAEESTMPVLTDGTHSWRLKATTFGDTKVKCFITEWGTNEGWVVLEVEFENLSGVRLISAWYEETKGGETSMIETFSREGIANVHVTDSHGDRYPAVVLGKSTIVFVVPEDRQGFTLYFLDCAPIELGL